ncbi:hypothetical protein [Oribacterium sp. FC2011]|uniref:hypothetical protein n=1 Tax=Oribacterium sp. FC2011 TaxID=1408311 RepID=UPI0004E1F26B|nr:hypothetical protein [Oribacterium sp. FC2011]
MKKKSLTILLMVIFVLSFGMSSFAGSPSPDMTMSGQTDGSVSNDMSKYVGTTLDHYLRDYPGQTFKVWVKETLGSERQLIKVVSYQLGSNADFPSVSMHPYFVEYNISNEEIEFLANTEAPEAYIYVDRVHVNKPGFKVCGLEVGDSFSKIDQKMKEQGLQFLSYNPGSVTKFEVAMYDAVPIPTYCYQNDNYTVEICVGRNNNICSLSVEYTPELKIKLTEGITKVNYPFPHYDTPPQPVQGITREKEYEAYDPTLYNFQTE